MKRYIGYSRYASLDGVEFMPSQDLVSPVDVERNPQDALLDLIYTLDPVTNLPVGSIDMLLSDKTSLEVRTFIENTIMREIPSDEFVPALRDHLNELDSEFIAKTSRNRFEPLEDYEARVKSYFEEIEKDKETQKRIEKLREDLKKLTSTDE